MHHVESNFDKVKTYCNYLAILTDVQNCWLVHDLHEHPNSCVLGKQSYNVACRGNWWISFSVHISFTRLDLKQETPMDKGMQQSLRSGKPRNILPTFDLSQ
jgi:hypothetical protein